MTPGDLAAVAPAIPAAVEGSNQWLTQLGLGTGALSLLSGSVYLLWRRFQSDNRNDNSSNIQQELFAQMQLAADQHLKAVNDIQGLLTAEREYSSQLQARLLENQRAWAAERISWDEERARFIREAQASELRIQSLNSELSRLGVQIREYAAQLPPAHSDARALPDHTET